MYGYGRTGDTGLPLVESYASGSNANHYVYDPQGTPLALLAYTGQTHYLALDGLGSAVGMINQSATHTAAYSHDPYGQVTANSPTGGGAHNVNIYRFIQQDSLETLADPTRANRYEYAAGNPVNYVDPVGRDRCYYSGAYGRTYCIERPSPSQQMTPFEAACTLVTLGAGFSAIGLGYRALAAGARQLVSQRSALAGAGAGSFSVGCTF
ncbi:hypothetical protein [Blastococcus montanus]|uniref:hypothetical protein n=1 Tax=Blastococcus montanus TaxID=3144973 RepID=UPI00320A5270